MLWTWNALHCRFKGDVLQKRQSTASSFKVDEDHKKLRAEGNISRLLGNVHRGDGANAGI